MPLRKNSVSLLILISTAVIFLFVAIYSFVKIKSLIVYNERIQHAQELKVSIEKLISSVKDATSSQRGFLITNDSSYLKEFMTSDTVIARHEKHIRFLIAKDVQQNRTLDSVMMQIRRRYAIMNYLLENKDLLMSRRGSEKRNDVMMMGQGVMFNIRSSVNLMSDREDEILAEQKIEKEKLNKITPLLMLSLSIVSLFVLLYSFYILRRELSQRLKFELELENKIEQLKRSNSDLEQFAYVASHDLQEPLRKIRSFGDRLYIKQKPLLTEDGKQLIDKMQSSAQRMQGLIDDLLSFSRLINVSDKFILTDLTVIIKEIIADLDVELQNKKARVICGPLPTIRIAPSLTRQLFQNLLTNALKFSKENIPPVISIASTSVLGKEIPGVAKTKEDHWFHKIIIQDNGIGFDDKYSEKIFVIFQRLHGRGEYEGTGIGLAVSKRIMTIHNGYITATATPDEGATFTLYFPS